MNRKEGAGSGAFRVFAQPVSKTVVRKSAGALIRRSNFAKLFTSDFSFLCPLLSLRHHLMQYGGGIADNGGGFTQRPAVFAQLLLCGVTCLTGTPQPV